jgi:SAM-dependent methyltransferase
LGRLSNLGISDFTIDCIELSPEMLERGHAAAECEGVADRMTFVEADLNSWTPAHAYDAVLSNQFLHHVVNLEHLFSELKRALRPHGSFIISDMIGRNGHRRWPEALRLVREFWRKLPPSYRVNHQLHCYEEMFEDWDCSIEGFEGVRAQDILPLLLEHFRFRFFFAFGNLIDPFVDRAFGPNFDPASEWDRVFIDEVHRKDEEELRLGRLKPTHMLAVAGTDFSGPPVFRNPLSPEFSVRMPGGHLAAGSSAPAVEVYVSDSWPRDPREELGLLCRRLSEHSGNVRNQTARLSWLERELEERTAWALRLDQEVERHTERTLVLEREVAERTIELELANHRPGLRGRLMRILSRL